MGTKQSVYEKSDTLNYVKLTPEQRALIKNAWSDVENNPQFYGNTFFSSFLDTYPQYIKFYTLEPSRSLNLDARTSVKFKMIMEALGYLLLDFHNKPKQLDRLVGYIAMKHKDMHLDKQDMFNFGYYLLAYLAETFPTKMTAECRDAMKCFLVNILHEVCRKMEKFRDYEITNSHNTKKSSRLPCKECTVLGENLIFGQTRVYWSEWKNHWDKRLAAWLSHDMSNVDRVAGSSTDDEDSPAQKHLTDNETAGTFESSKQQVRKKSVLPRPERTSRELSASRLALQTLSRRLESKGDEHSASRQSLLLCEREDNGGETRRAAVTPRERYRTQSLARDAASPRADSAVLRRRIRTSRMGIVPLTRRATSGEPKKPDLDEDDNYVQKCSNAARERRRRAEQFSFDLK